VSGTRWVQRELLEKHPDLDLKVYAIWFNMVATDDRSLWDSELLNDPRVVYLWDQDKIVGRWFGSHPHYGNGKAAWWDTYLLYGPDSTWEQEPTELISTGHTILMTGEDLLRDALSFEHK
jgi:hypothetical protein